MVTNINSAAAPLEGRFDELRAQFPILDRKIYLNSNSLGALSTSELPFFDIVAANFLNTFNRTCRPPS